MIDRINDNRYTNAYRNSSIKKLSEVKGETLPFSLDMADDGVVWDRQDSEKKKESDSTKNANYQKNEKKDSYLSQNKNEFEKDNSQDSKILEENQTRIDKGNISLENVTKVISNIINNVKGIFINIFNFIWYGDEKTESESELLSTKNADSALATIDSDEASKTKEELIRESISKKDSKEIERLITDNYSKIPARNTSLLTKYDKRGNIVNINGADEAVILKGREFTKL